MKLGERRGVKASRVGSVSGVRIDPETGSWEAAAVGIAMTMVAVREAERERKSSVSF